MGHVGAGRVESRVQLTSALLSALNSVRRIAVRGGEERKTSWFLCPRGPSFPHPPQFAERWREQVWTGGAHTREPIQLFTASHPLPVCIWNGLAPTACRHKRLDSVEKHNLLSRGWRSFTAPALGVHNIIGATVSTLDLFPVLVLLADATAKHPQTSRCQKTRAQNILVLESLPHPTVPFT